MSTNTGRLNRQQVKELREVVSASLARAKDLLLQARCPATGAPDSGAMAFYEAIITRDEALLTALPLSGKIEIELEGEESEDEENED